MTDINAQQRSIIVAEYIRQREALLGEFPELAEDEQALADTLDGQTEAVDLVAGLIRAARQEEAFSKALGEMMAEQRDRKARREQKAERYRTAALAIMQAMGERKIEQADFTVSIRSVPASLEIPDDNLVPDDFAKYERKIDRNAVKDFLKSGEKPNWASLRDGGITLSARWK